MKIVPLEGTTMSLPELVDLARSEAVVLTRGGRPVATVREFSGPEDESTALLASPRFAAILEESRRSHRESGGMGLDDLRAELGLDAGTAGS